MFEWIVAVLVITALVLIAVGAGMAENHGITVPTNSVWCGGLDPNIVYMTAEGTPGPRDNVEPGSVPASEVKVCDAAAEEYLGTADLNIENDSGEEGGNSAMTDFAEGDVVPVITGPVDVVKFADDNGVTAGKVVRPGQTGGDGCENISTGTARYAIGRAKTTAADTVKFVMRQW